MKAENINNNWKFWPDKNAFALVWNVPKDAEDITLPHDAMRYEKPYEGSPNKGNTGYRDGGIYNYVKMLTIPDTFRSRKVQLMFEGIYENAFIYVNGQLAGKNPYGYSTFIVDIKDYLNYNEENEIRVVVRNSNMTNSRWYSGGGIYRDAYLATGNLVHIPLQGVHITTESVEEDWAVLRINTKILNHSSIRKNVLLETIMKDSLGNIVSREEVPTAVFLQGEREISQRILVSKPKLWSAETPELYFLTSRVLEEDVKTGQWICLDETETSFGIRTLSVDAARGFRVNGKTVKLRGACIHHDSGLLGAATYKDAQYRQIQKLKDAGFNAVRMSHQPMAPSMLFACDEIGMYVMDETFDMWTRGKSDCDYSVHFSEYWEKDVEAMVRKDYNHPCVILYSVGNEIPEIGTDLGAKICQDIHNKIKSMDSTRYTLASINGVFAAGDSVDEIVADVVEDLSKTGEIEGNVNDFMTLMDGHLDEIVRHPAITKRLESACSATDIAGYNYMSARYEPDGKQYKNRIMVGSETYPPDIARNWAIVKKMSQLIGDFTWTGWDYIGEAGVGVPAYQWGEGGFGAKFPCQLAYTGDFDITGFRRPASYYREIVFGLRTEPYITVQNPYRYGQHLIKTPWVISDSHSEWTYPNMEGRPVIVEIYASGTETELFCNGKSLGKKPSGEGAGYMVRFETSYEPGILTAVTYDGEKEIGRSQLKTTGDAEQMVLLPEEKYGEELLYIPIELLDSQGELVSHQDRKLFANVKGGAVLEGFGSCNPKPEYSYNESMTETFHGRALMILKKISQEPITIEVTTNEDMSSDSKDMPDIKKCCENMSYIKKHTTWKKLISTVTL